jgi:hypothetical protein
VTDKQRLAADIAAIVAADVQVALADCLDPTPAQLTRLLTQSLLSLMPKSMAERRKAV